MPTSPKISRAGILALGGVLSFALVGVIVLAGPGSGRVAPPGAGSTEPEGVRGGGRAPIPAVAPLQGERAAAEDPAAGDVGRVDVASALPVGGARLRVVAAATSRPVPGAEVFFGDERGRGGRGRGDFGRRLDSFVESAVRLVADAAGEVSLPPVERRTFVVAKADGLFGVGSIDRGAAEATVELQADETVLVRVVDAEGRPVAGVDVVLAVESVGRLQDRASTTTGPDGLGELPHLQIFRSAMPQVDPAMLARAVELGDRLAMIEQNARLPSAVPAQLAQERRAELEAVRAELRRVDGAVRGSSQRGRRSEPPQQGPSAGFADFVVTARVPQLAPAVRRFAATAVPTGVVELRIGALGALDVRLMGPDGAPLQTPCRIELRRSDANPLPGNLGAMMVGSVGGLVRLRRDKPLGDAAVRFEPVGAGQLLSVSVQFADRDFAFRQDLIEGPFDGELREVELVVPDWFSVLSGRLVDPAGRPWAGIRAELLVSGAAGRIEGEAITTDADGRFELPLRLQEPVGPYSLEVQARSEDLPVGALVDVPDLLAGRSRDLGEVVVAGLPMLASGTARDDRGEPVPRANVLLQIYRAGAGEGGDWTDVAFVRAGTGEDGTFRLYGERRAEPMRVVARARGHATAESAPLPFGATFDPVLIRLGELVAAGFLPSWLPRGAVRLELSRDGRVVRREDLRARGDGAFRAGIGGLEPGAYDLECTLRGIGTVFAQSGITIAPGDTANVAGVDLRDAVFRYVVRAVDQAGAPLSDPGSPLFAQVVDPTGQLRWVPFPWRGDRVEFFSSERVSSVVALASGRSPARMQIAPGESQLVLPALNPLELELPGLRALVGERRVRVSLVFDGETGLPMSDLQAIDQTRGQNRGYQRAALGKSSGAWLGENDVVRVPLMLNGRYRIVARISQSGQRGNVSKEIGVVDAVLDRAEVQRAVVTPPAAILQQAIAELDAR